MKYNETFSYKSFKNSKYFSLKYENYFSIYDDLLKKFRKKKYNLCGNRSVFWRIIIYVEKFFWKKC